MVNHYFQIGKRIRFLRRQAGLTQEQLAEKVNLSYQFIGSIERGIGHPTIKRLGEIAKALGASFGELFEDFDISKKSKRQVLKELERLLKNRDDKDAQLVLSVSKKILEHVPVKHSRTQ